MMSYDICHTYAHAIEHVICTRVQLETPYAVGLNTCYILQLVGLTCVVQRETLRAG